MISTLHVRLLGDFQVSQGDTPLKDLNSGRLQSLLAFLLLHRDTPQPRSQIAFAFWPDSSEAHAYLSLRKTLHLLRRVLPDAENRLLIDHTSIQWVSSAPTVVDVADFATAIARASPSASAPEVRVALQEAVQHYGGDLLPGCYDEWVIPERERLREAFLQGLERLISIFEHDGQYAEAINYAQRLLRHDPLREESYRLLMRLYATNGDRPAAIRIYNRCVTLLQRELGVEPGPATQELYGSLLPILEPAPIISPHALMLPAQTTIFIGREKELASASALLRRPEVRLVTFTGTAGTGKTRLALEVISDLGSDYAGGVAFVPLAPVGQADLVVSAIAQALGAREVAGQTLIETLVDFLREKRVLLLLDNFEHVIKAAPIVAQLLASCPNLNVLVTSRAVLHLRGEHEYVIPPLQLPDLNNLPWLEELAQYEAISLFVERAIEVRPDFALTHQNAHAVAEICARIDGLPLAIELAAARVKFLSTQAIANKLGEQGGKLKLLVGGALDLPPRQQALRNAIAWSYDLLPPDEQALFRRLGAFVGGCTVDAAQAVASPVDIDIRDGLESLVSKSLVKATEGPEQYEHMGGESRYWMLETLREYAREELDQNGEAEITKQRHAEHYLALAEEAESKLRGPRQKEWFARLDAEHDNLRAALDWLLTVDNVQMSLRIAGALGYFWSRRSYWSIGSEWLEKVLNNAGSNEVGTGGDIIRARANVLRWAGIIAREQATSARAFELCSESLDLFRLLEDKRGVAGALYALGSVALYQSGYELAAELLHECLSLGKETQDKYSQTQALYALGLIDQDKGDYPASVLYLEESLALARELGDFQSMGDAMDRLSWSFFRQGRYEQAEKLAEEVIELGIEFKDPVRVDHGRTMLALDAQEQGDYGRAITLFERVLADQRATGQRNRSAYTLNNLGYVLLFTGDYERAKALLYESLAILSEVGDNSTINVTINLGHIALLQGEFAEARQLLGSALALSKELGTKRMIVESVERLAAVDAARGQALRAARLFGAAELLRENIGDPLRLHEYAEYKRNVDLARQAGDQAGFDRAWAEGRAMPLAEAISYALGVDDQ